MNLFPYQVTGAKFLASGGSGLFDEPGLGKSAQALTAAVMMGAKTVRVVCPASVVGVWHREAKLWAPGVTVEAMSYERAVKTWESWIGSDVLVFDESHYLKSRSAKRSQALLSAPCLGKSTKQFALTGTPMPNHPGELFMLLRALAPAALHISTSRPLNWGQFITKFCVTQQTPFTDFKIVGGKNHELLTRILDPFFLRRRKADVMTDLPPLRVTVTPLTNAAAFKALRTAEREAPQPLTTAIHLATGASLGDDFDLLAQIKENPHVATLRRLTGLAKVPAAVEYIRELLDGGVEKLVVFAQHTEVVQQIHAAFESECVMITGDTKFRSLAVANFQQDPITRVFIGQLQAAGTGITLTAASRLLFVESSWVPAENEQAAMRIHRIGQKNACEVEFLTLEGSLDERIQAVCARKLSDIVKVFG